ncbi:hypothetical protein [Streptomyces bobili]
MIPGKHRLKNGAPLLGSEDHGEPGPFGVWTDGHDQEHDPADPPDDELRY